MRQPALIIVAAIASGLLLAVALERLRTPEAPPPLPAPPPPVTDPTVRGAGAGPSTPSPRLAPRAGGGAAMGGGPLPQTSPTETLERIRRLRDRVRDEPEDAMSRFLLGRALLELGEGIEAAEALRSAIAFVEPEHRKYIGRLVIVACFQANRPDLARTAARDLMPAEPEAMDRWLLRAAADRAGGYPSDVPEGLRFRLPAGCPAPAGVAYADVAAAAGLDRRDQGRGVGVGDIDGDGREDVIYADYASPLHFYRNVTPPGGPLAFEEVTEAWGPEAPDTAPWSVSLVDYDGDGDLDIYAPAWGYPFRLYRWDANPGGEGRAAGRYVDVTAEAGVDGRGADGWCVTWADYDGDGDLDVYVPCVAWDEDLPHPNILYRNNGDGTFTDVARKAGVDSAAASFGAAFGDFDEDGDPDLAVSNQQGRPPHLYRNDGDGTFTDIAREAGIDAPHWGFPVFFADFTNDGRLDLLVCGNEIEFLRGWDAGEAEDPTVVQALYVNEGDGRFRRLGPEAGLDRVWGTMGAAVGDFDADGRLDFFLGNGGPQIDRLEPNALYLNLGEGRFGDCAPALGLDDLGKGHGALFWDADGDGALDLLHAMGAVHPDDQWPNRLYRNTRTNGHHWFRIDLRAPPPNTRAVGARIRVEAGGRIQVQEVNVTEGFGCTPPHARTFGLGEADRVERLVVRWPGGTLQTFEDLAADRAWRLDKGGTPRPLRPAAP